ncbi:hypothetical protein [Streptomyces liangshanensis]|uniref:hypothetical protein n=1 Tax=Streptomyces liangshanensis TaxID=2717324 RepID=UPI0036DD87FE
MAVFMREACMWTHRLNEQDFQLGRGTVWLRMTVGWARPVAPGHGCGVRVRRLRPAGRARR